MAHYAYLDENNVVTKVVVGKDETEAITGFDSWEDYYSAQSGQRCVRTSYNTSLNKHQFGGTPFRGNFAAIGYKYDEELDVFISPKPFADWVFDAENISWTPPIPEPEPLGIYQWSVEDGTWVKPDAPFASWVWNNDYNYWEAPVAYPEDGETYTWDEESTSWTLVE